MKYEQPYGITDPNAPYINGNPAIGVQGSIPPAAAFEYPMRELVAMIAGGGLIPSDSDLQQLLQAVRTQYVNFCIDQGTLANNYITTFSPAVTVYRPGQVFRVRIANNNTGASSFDAGGGRYPIKRMDGSDPAAGDLKAGSVVELLWNDAGACFEMTNYAGAGGSGGGGSVTVSGLINVQVFTASSTYLPTTGATKALIFITGGGAAAAYEGCAYGGGGGAGATVIHLLNLAGPPIITSEAVTIGAGGVNMGSGGQSSFGTVAVAGGGLGPPPSMAGGGQSGLGGSATAGLIQITGGDGEIASRYSIDGHGGASFWGGGGAACGSGDGGHLGRAFGSGGGGSSTQQNNGAPGICYVMEF